MEPAVSGAGHGGGIHGPWRLGGQPSEPPRRPPPPPEPNAAAIAEIGISARELEVLAQLANGAPNKVIARQLGISPNTVKTHVARLFEKLGAANRTEAIARARALRIVP